MTRRFLSYLPLQRLRGAAGRSPATDPADRREEELLHARAAQAHDHLRHAPRHPADGRQGFLLRDRAAVGHRPGHRLRALRRPSDGRHRLGQPARERRRAHRRRLRQARAAISTSATSSTCRSSTSSTIRASPSASSTRSPAPSARAANGWSPSPRSRCRSSRCMMRRSFGVAGNNYATPRSAASRARGLAGGRRRRHPAGRRHRGGLQAPARRSRRSRRAARRDQRPHRERARPDRPAQPLPDGGDDRSARHPPAGSANGSPTPTGSWPSPRGWCRARCSSGLRSSRRRERSFTLKHSDVRVTIRTWGTQQGRNK